MKILAYEGISPVSRIIRWQTRYPVSHVAMEMSDGTVWEAWHKGGVIKRTNFKEGHTKGTYVREYGYRGMINEEKALEFWKEHEGDRYDFRNVFRFIPHWRPKPNDSWFCSEIVACASRAGGILLQDERSDLLSPRDVCISPKLIHNKIQMRRV